LRRIALPISSSMPSASIESPPAGSQASTAAALDIRPHPLLEDVTTLTGPSWRVSFCSDSRSRVSSPVSDRSASTTRKWVVYTPAARDCNQTCAVFARSTARGPDQRESFSRYEGTQFCGLFAGAQPAGVFSFRSRSTTSAKQSFRVEARGPATGRAGTRKYPYCRRPRNTDAAWRAILPSPLHTLFVIHASF
jgi:hypothetical protein